MLPGFSTSMRPLLGVSRVLAIASGKGGVGKTTVAVNLALALRQSGASAITPDPGMAGHIIRQTLQDVQWGLLDYLVIDLPPGTGENKRS
jgi:Mrp family chromosome partitioning ATPase